MVMQADYPLLDSCRLVEWDMAIASIDTIQIQLLQYHILQLLDQAHQERVACFKSETWRSATRFTG